MSPDYNRILFSLHTMEQICCRRSVLVTKVDNSILRLLGLRMDDFNTNNLLNLD